MASCMTIISEAYDSLWRMIIRPPRELYSPEDLGPDRFASQGTSCERTDFHLMNGRGQRLECSYWRPCSGLLGALPCVVYLHGNSSSRLEAGVVLEYLLPRNIAVFSMDLAGSGRSDGEYVSLGYYEEQDLRVAVEHLRTSGRASAVALWGRSMGAATAVLRAGEDEELAACVLDSPFASLRQVVEEVAASNGPFAVPRFLVSMAIPVVAREVQSRAGFDIEDVLPASKAPTAVAPVLFAVALDDDFVLPHHARDLHDTWGGSERRFVTFGGGHNGRRPESFYRDAAEFLERHLCTASTREALKAMGFDREVSAEAARRHTSVEASLEWALRRDLLLTQRSSLADVAPSVPGPRMVKSAPMRSLLANSPTPSRRRNHEEVAKLVQV